MKPESHDIDGDLFGRTRALAECAEQTIGDGPEKAAEARSAGAGGNPDPRRLADLVSEDLGPGTERLSEEIDELLLEA